MNLVLATSNAGKVREFELLLDGLGISLKMPLELGFTDIIIEDGLTFEANALIKAKTLLSATGLPVLADDSGLEVDALGGAPGLHTARYAGPNATNADNRKKLLEALKGITDLEKRSARFVCVLCLARPGLDPLYFKGACEGFISVAERGQGGFGYDPLFIPSGYAKTFAEISDAEKNPMSHRGLATKLFIDFVKTQH